MDCLSQPGEHGHGLASGFRDAHAVEKAAIARPVSNLRAMVCGISGIGLAAAKILASRNATVHILDVNQPSPNELPDGVRFHAFDVSSWKSLKDVFDAVGPIDFAFANAGVSEETNYFADVLDAEGELQEATFSVLGVNLRGVLHFVKLAWSSIVITMSATAYAPEQSLPVGLRDNITINGVAPAATITRLLPTQLAAPIIQQGLPVSDAHFVGLALVHSATATQDRMVEPYGKEDEADRFKPSRWNRRVILTLGNAYTELEELEADLRPFCFGQEKTRLTRLQQAATDFRLKL
ncbi:short chain dehydrogenase reductase [Periconia macrospinosa]|uniref:Short chain dehydrogenase reductase n=1 Tax=Periconia macrospinosa TaxID=97972 RepID=A0A2V1D4T7_9PLEO|nr:short chain dehydrogenase reductase [Periconia macrospinosa]